MAESQSNSNIAFLYPGQGSQFPGMGKEIHDEYAEARALFAAVDACLPMSITELCFDADEETLRLTENTQPAILTVSAAIDRVLAARGVTPRWVAGHSLGEYSALVAADVLDAGAAAAVVHNRGRYMQEAVAAGVGSMAAILGLDDAVVTGLCGTIGGEETVEVANLNAPGQVVVAGHRGAVENLIDVAKEAGARRAILLNVSAPFHCSLMQPAADRLVADLAAVDFAEPRVPVVCNVDAAPVVSGDDARDALGRQVTSTVRWTETLEYLGEQGADVFVEVGPGRVLSGLVKRTLGRGVAIHAVQDVEGLDAVIAELGSV